MIFKALQFELSRFKFHSLSLKILKITEFNLSIFQTTYFDDFNFQLEVKNGLEKFYSESTFQVGSSNY